MIQIKSVLYLRRWIRMTRTSRLSVFRDGPISPVDENRISLQRRLKTKSPPPLHEPNSKTAGALQMLLRIG